MHTVRRSKSSYEGLSGALRVFLARRAEELTGLSLIGLTGLAAAALATWSVDDPSLNNATDGAVHNLLGWPGAIVADLLMQLLGLGAIAAILPMLLWGWRLMRSGEMGRRQLRLALWIIGVAAATAMASTLPATDRWPLPTGLGGVVGDAVLSATRAVTGLTGSTAGSILGFAFSALAILSLTAACGFGLSDDEPHRETQDPDEPAPTRRSRRAAEWEDAEDTGTDEPAGWGIVSLGALAHAFMSLRGALRRRVEARRARLDGDGIGSTSGRAGPGGPRREPRLEPVTTRPSPFTGPHHDEDEEAFDDPLPALRGPVRNNVVPVPAPVRVAPVPAAPKPGRRMVREAHVPHPDEGDFQLPALGLLAEPKVPQGPIVSSDALEQNAALLEGTLEDFGVRGDILDVRPGPVVTLYELEPAPGTKSSRVISLADDIARSMCAVSARVAVVAGPQRDRHRTAQRTGARRCTCASCWPRRISRPPSTSWPCAWARPSAASRSSPISRACRTCWWPAPPARASRWRSTR